jgi:hypothetical protein
MMVMQKVQYLGKMTMMEPLKRLPMAVNLASMKVLSMALVMICLKVPMKVWNLVMASTKAATNHRMTVMQRVQYLEKMTMMEPLKRPLMATNFSPMLVWSLILMLDLMKAQQTVRVIPLQKEKKMDCPMGLLKKTETL